MDRKLAMTVQGHLINIIEECGILINITKTECSGEEFSEIKSVLGRFIGQIDIDLLSIIYKQYPELDHLKSNLDTFPPANIDEK